MGRILDGIYSWIQNIVCFICFLNIFLEILPGEGYRKYVRFFGSLVLVVIVMEPLGNFASVSEEFERIWRQESQKEAYGELEITTQGIEELRMEKVNKVYEEELSRQVEEIVRGNGLEPIEVEFVFDIVEGVRKIEKATIRVKEEMQLDEEKKGKQVEDLKKELEEVYQIDSAHINISIEG